MGNARRIRPGRRSNLTSTARSAARKACTFAFCRACGLAMVSYLVSSIHPHFDNWYKTLKIARVVGAWSSGDRYSTTITGSSTPHDIFTVSLWRRGTISRGRVVQRQCTKITKLLSIALGRRQLK